MLRAGGGQRPLACSRGSSARHWPLSRALPAGPMRRIRLSRSEIVINAFLILSSDLSWSCSLCHAMHSPEPLPATRAFDSALYLFVLCYCFSRFARCRQSWRQMGTRCSRVSCQERWQERLLRPSKTRSEHPGDHGPLPGPSVQERVGGDLEQEPPRLVRPSFWERLLARLAERARSGQESPAPSLRGSFSRR